MTEGGCLEGRYHLPPQLKALAPEIFRAELEAAAKEARALTMRNRPNAVDAVTAFRQDLFSFVA
jgi:hypothetical protein